MARGIILAAGRGSRMLELTRARHKSLIPFEGKPLVDWQVQSLSEAGVSPLGMVRGYCSEALDHLGSRGLTFFENPIWSKTNMVHTLLCAQEWLESETCVVSYSDIVYSSGAVSALLQSPHPLALSYDPQWRALWESRFDNPLEDAETFSLSSDDRLTEIGQKTDDVEKIQGQFMGLIKFTPQSWGEIKEILEELGPERVHSLDMTSLLQLRISKGQPVHGVVNPHAWYEFDCPTDLQVYGDLVKKSGDVFTRPPAL